MCWNQWIYNPLMWKYTSFYIFWKFNFNRGINWERFLGIDISVERNEFKNIYERKNQTIWQILLTDTLGWHNLSRKLGSLGDLLRGSISLLGLLGVQGEQDHLALVLLQPLGIQLQGLNRFVPAQITFWDFWIFFLSVLIQLMYNVRFEPRLIRSWIFHWRFIYIFTLFHKKAYDSNGFQRNLGLVQCLGFD